jgi:starch phosphorylase
MINIGVDEPVLTRESQLRHAIIRHARYALAKKPADLTPQDLLLSSSLAVRELLIDAMIETEERYQRADAKRLYYLSMEFLMGRSLDNNLHNLGLSDSYTEALASMAPLMGQPLTALEDIHELEADAALGNGGLGRLAACFLDSLATLGMPGFGCGINYEYGLFKQELDNGYQKEKPDRWRASGTPWLIAHPDESCVIPVYGRVEHSADRHSSYNPMWMDWKVIIGVPSDMPVAGYGGGTVNRLRLYSATSPNEFDIGIFNQGDYIKAVEQNISSQTISKVLYPSDTVASGKELRLVQEYFLVACSLRDIVKQYKKNHLGFRDFPDKVAIQMNDTHPALAVAELMRILIDENDVPWVDAWGITRATLGFTNHTLMPEALEKWPLQLFEHVLPRHLQIVCEINDRFIADVTSLWPGDREKIRRISIIEDGAEKQVRMAHLAIVGSHSVNGVAELHSKLVKESLAPDFYQLWPERFNNKTNGVTQRRWLLKSNPLLARLINQAIGDGWITDLNSLRALEPYAGDSGFRSAFASIKRANKARLAQNIKDLTGVTVDPASLFDVQVKRIHEYKRQLLNVMHVIYEYLSLVEDGVSPQAPRTHIFAGKAAPGYLAAKQIVKLINSVALVIDKDPRARDLIRVVLIPDYRVSLAEKIIPAADLSEQISTAGTEASGTGNMKLALNGALTIGTLDGANIEIMQEVGRENMFIFGLTAPEIERIRGGQSYNPRELYEHNNLIKRVLDSLLSDSFCKSEPGLFRGIFDSLVNRDPYFHLADFQSYVETQTQASAEFLDRTAWTKKAILNVARIGKFSSDRAILQYSDEIWGLNRYMPA